MKKENVKWSIRDLVKKVDTIEFPEFQREPTVWDLNKKQKLIDSILRQFDIASIYLYKRNKGRYECIDGRQRINSIISFLGLNGPAEELEGLGSFDNKFKFKSSDELLGSNALDDFNDKRFDVLKANQQNKILDYKLNVLEITDIDNDEELNLMFLRLQMGAPLNAGEKLNAMKGDLRDLIFGSKEVKVPLGVHPFFKGLNIPTRRFSKELTAAQIAINFFSTTKDNEFKRARFVDLQEFFKIYIEFNDQGKKLASLLKKRLDKVYDSLKDKKRLVLKNRAIGVTTFFFINKLIESNKEKEIDNFTSFLQKFLRTLREQVEKGIDIEKKYRDLLKFQTYISQAAVERYAVENRQIFLEEYFKHYQKTKKIKGDS